MIFTQPPTWREFGGSYKFVLVAGAGAGAWLMGLLFKWPRQKPPAGSAWMLILGWWACQPLALFAFSLLTGNNVFVTRYLWLSLPGAALAATAAAGCFIPGDFWKPAAAILGTGVVLLMGGVPHLAPLHHGSNWREAAREIRSLGIQPDYPRGLSQPIHRSKIPGVETRLQPPRLSVLPPAHLSSGWHTLSVAVHHLDRSRAIRSQHCWGRSGFFG